MKYILLIIISLSFWNCDNQSSEISITETFFNFKITGTITGNISHHNGIATVKCENDRTIITFSETIENHSDSADAIIGDIIIGFQSGDTTGTFTLQGIAESRLNNHVGIVAILDNLTYDELAETYVSNVQRYQEVSKGNININNWRTQPKQIIQGNINSTVEAEGEMINLTGSFGIILKADDEVCL